MGITTQKVREFFLVARTYVNQVASCSGDTVTRTLNNISRISATLCRTFWPAKHDDSARDKLRLTAVLVQ
jgi:hypothetical protein